MARRRYQVAGDGEWFRPTHRGFRHQCCDCALIHVVDFHVDTDDGAVELRFRRNARATAAARRSFKFSKDSE